MLKIISSHEVCGFYVCTFLEAHCVNSCEAILMLFDVVKSHPETNDFLRIGNYPVLFRKFGKEVGLSNLGNFALCHT